MLNRHYLKFFIMSALLCLPVGFIEVTQALANEGEEAVSTQRDPVHNCCARARVDPFASEAVEADGVRFETVARDQEWIIPSN